MGKVERFEDLRCWQSARELVKEIYQLTKTERLARDFGLRDQLQRSAVSIMTNIAEGFARYNRKDFMRFLNYAQSSAAELKSLLYIVQDSGWVSANTISNLQNNSEKVKSMILGLINYLKSYRTTDSIKETPTTYYLIDNENNILPQP